MCIMKFDSKIQCGRSSQPVESVKRNQINRQSDANTIEKNHLHNCPAK